MRRVVFNQKGGVGKSSITVNLAAISASQGLRTLVLDLDPQCNASQYLLGMAAYHDGEGPTPNVGTFFAQTLSFRLKEKDPQEYVHATAFENLFVLPSNPELGEIEHMLESKHKIYKLRSLVKALEREFDVIYIDTPPAYNFYTLSALIAAERVLIPFDCDAFSRKALYTLLDNIREARDDHNDSLEVEGIVVNQFQPRARLPQQLVDSLTEEGLPIIGSYLSASVVMRESHDQCKPLVHLAPRHKLTEEFTALHNALAGV
ncbi:ParA family protein [Alcanivorax sp. S71-1-4]|jgi:chromosome partitioning protein|uniref:ParA family protein n=1 Tax=Alcanivorax sp. S71-1-4 TaxID=1177159 RepID=UPI00135A6B35|nr:ParA family protein [Alcanivorax sp. S71-1-4]KAF0810528.1 ParA family protein [Alcanivorax sp. S71-1-4]